MAGNMNEFKPKPFLKASTDFLEAQRNAWLDCIKDTPGEAQALAYAIREGWLMPNETLDRVSILNLFPDAWPNDWARKVETGQCTEREAKFGIAAAVKANMAEADAGIAGVAKKNFPVPVLAEQTPVETARAVEGYSERARESERNDRVDASRTLVAGNSIQTVKGPVAGLTSETLRVHRFLVDDLDLYTHSRDMLEYVQAAQVQGLTLRVEHKPGDYGNLVLKAVVTDP